MEKPEEPAADPYIDWLEIEAIYTSGGRLKEVADANQISTQKIVAHALRQGWKRPDAAVSRKATNSKSGHLAKRLITLVDRQISAIEEQADMEGGLADPDREARALSNLTRTLDKLIELERESASLGKQRAGDGRTRAEAERTLRARLESRLARLAGEDETNRVS